MATTHRRKPVYATQLSAVTLEANTLAINTTFTPPTGTAYTATYLATNSVSLGTTTHANTDFPLHGVYLSVTLGAVTSASVTHYLGGPTGIVSHPVSGWWAVNRTNITATTAVVYCSDIDSSGTQITFCSLGAGTHKIFAF